MYYRKLKRTGEKLWKSKFGTVFLWQKLVKNAKECQRLGSEIPQDPKVANKGEIWTFLRLYQADEKRSKRRDDSEARRKEGLKVNFGLNLTN